jgi:phenylpropionate dioxygenase-like ring-hydroxylating dioxygenase large terminal subunit
MLTHKENEELTQTGPGTIMGNVMRSYWIPALLSSELPENDGAPVRVKLLGEDLVAFRDTNGAVGLLDEYCPHRAVSLALAVNEDCGLRCLYHGWKFDVTGQCVDQPTEPKGAILAKAMKTVAYPTREVAGMIWAYMGVAGQEPAFPNFEWFDLPSAQCAAFKVRGDCNYAQLLEGSIDTVHAGVLHRAKPWNVKIDNAAATWQTTLQAKLEVEYTAYGMRYAGIRETGADTFNARVTPMVMPCYTLIPFEISVANKGSRRLVNCFVPRDDESTWVFQFIYDYANPIDVQKRVNEGGLWIDENFRKLSNRDNWYNQDRKAMKTDNLSGLKGIMVQDHAVGETQGKILDRTRERLGTSDLAVVAWRRLMLKTAHALRDHGTPPPASTSPSVPFNQIRPEVINFKRGETWRELAPLSDGLVLETAD